MADVSSAIAGLPEPETTSETRDCSQGANLLVQGHRALGSYNLCFQNSLLESVGPEQRVSG